MMLLAVAQQEDELPSVRREAIAALVPLLEDDTRKEEVLLQLLTPLLHSLPVPMHHCFPDTMASVSARFRDGTSVSCH